MTQAYTLDLRKKINLLLGKKILITVVFRMLDSTRKTIYTWMKRPSSQETPCLEKHPSFTDLAALADSI
jgi:hypothetical protein